MSHELPARSQARCALFLVGAAAFWPPVYGQQAAGASVSVVPSLSVQQTFTDNVALSTDNRRSESITQISPGISIAGRSGRVQGSLDYSLNALFYARESDRNTLQNALNGVVRAELIDNHAFIDARATISQQTISAFGTQSGNSGLINDNRSEVATLSVSPSLRGNLGGVVDVAATAGWSASHSDSTDAGDTTSLSALLSLGGRQGLFGWGLNATRQVSGYASEQDVTQDSVIASLSFSPDTELRLTLRGGREATDVQGGTRQSSDTWGWGVDWIPTERTQLSLQSDRRYFGSSHTFTARHRMARSIWSYSDTRGVSGEPGLAGADVLRAQFNQLYTNCVSSLRDPALCNQLVRQILGLDPTVSLGFLNSARSLQRGQNLSVALSGLRTTVTLSAFRAATSRLDGVVYGEGDLSQVDQVRQLGYSVAVSYRLTPVSSLAFVGARQKTLDAGSQPGNDQRSATLSWSSSLGPRMTTSLALRHTLFESDSNPYNESAIIGSLSLRF